MDFIDFDNIPGYSIGCLMNEVWEESDHITEPSEELSTENDITTGCWADFTPMGEIINALQNMPASEIRARLAELNSFIKCD